MYLYIHIYQKAEVLGLTVEAAIVGTDTLPCTVGFLETST
jgi:hypothetical protein